MKIRQIQYSAFAGDCFDSSVRIELGLFGLTQCRQDWVLESRVLEEHLLFYVQSGYGCCRWGESKISLSPGMLLYMPAGVQHEFLPDGAQPVPCLYHLRFQIFTASHELRVNLNAPLVDLAPDAEILFGLLLKNHRQEAEFPGGRLAGLLGALLSYLPLPDVQRKPLAVDTLCRLSDMVRSNPGAGLSPADLADEVGLSPDYFARKFKESVGVSPRHWIMRERVKAAAAFLADHPWTSISQTAIRFGFSDIFLFSRQFKAVMGQSPRDYLRSG